MTHNCPVCGYDKLIELPADFSICPCCGTEFGLDDDLVSHEALRARWIALGAQWWSSANPPPLYWSPVQQLRRAGFDLTDDDLIAIADTGLVTMGEVSFSITSAVRMMLSVGGTRGQKESLALVPTTSARTSNLPAAASVQQTAILEMA